jgi:hypothetical protein
MIWFSGWITLWPEWHFGQSRSTSILGGTFATRSKDGGTSRPEWPLGQRLFGQGHFGRRDTLASVTLAGDTLASDTLARVILWPKFFLLPLGYQRVNKNSRGGTIGKNLKKKSLFFRKKGSIFFSNLSLWSPLWNFYSPFCTPKESRKTGQSVSGQSGTLAKVALAD